MPSNFPIRPESRASVQTAASSDARRRDPSALSLETVQSSLTSNVHSETSWTVSDIAKAGRLLLHTPPSALEFENEEEMRRVYSLIYDAFRYRSVLNEALTDASFYGRFSDHIVIENIVILLFYDLYKRRFLPRDGRSEALKSVLFREAGIPEVDADLWGTRVRLAAALARIRIKNNALKLSKLLPNHLKDDRVTSVDEAFATGWVNTFKSKESIPMLIEGAGMKPVKQGQTYLETNNYQFDPICPKFILCHPEQRGSLISSPLVRELSIILQDRSFCVGPAVLERVLVQHQLTGPVVQTHITTPRSVAYLANILADNDKIDMLLAFGAGEKKQEYESYLSALGVSNARIYAERFVDVPSESSLLEGVVGVLATPPNTYSGVTNPVDLVCSRGGDMEMLEVLTDVSGNTGCRERVKAILEEQRQTLRHSMSKPQTQVVVYVTHSVLPEENGKMVRVLVDEMNRTAWERHAEDASCRTAHSTQSKSDVAPAPAPAPASDVATSPSKTSLDARATSPKRPASQDVHRSASSTSNIKVPPCDLFEIGEIPNICLNADLKMEEEGCFVALLQRKEILRLDSMYMINIAEQRGLFGDPGSTPAKKARSHKAKRLDMEAARASARNGTAASARVCRPRRKAEIERIAAPTMASLQRQVRDKSHSDDSSGSSVITTCARHEHHKQEFDGIKEDPDQTGCLKEFDRVVEKQAQHLAALKTTLDTQAGNHRLASDVDKPRRECVPSPKPRGSLTYEEQTDLVRRLSNPTQSSLSRLRTKLLRGGNHSADVQYQIPADIQNKHMERLNRADFNISVPPNTPLAGARSVTRCSDLADFDADDADDDDDYKPFL